jgi:flavin reductase (DIM6/NTAB) family NADH-FMN oxidoreductase RutF
MAPSLNARPAGDPDPGPARRPFGRQEPLAEAQPVLSRITRAISVISVSPADEPHGMTVDSLTSVSQRPPLIAVAVTGGSRMVDLVQREGCFAASVLAEGQQDLARWFASRRRGTGPAEFASVDHRAGRLTGAPLLAGAVAWLECRLRGTSTVGDHVLLVAEVLEAAAGPAGHRPLLRVGRRYVTADPWTNDIAVTVPGSGQKRSGSAGTDLTGRG